jgi:hypothetical protein
VRVLKVERVHLLSFARAALSDRGGELREPDARHQMLRVHGHGGLRYQPAHPAARSPAAAILRLSMQGIVLSALTFRLAARRGADRGDRPAKARPQVRG